MKVKKKGCKAQPRMAVSLIVCGDLTLGEPRRRPADRERPAGVPAAPSPAASRPGFEGLVREFAEWEANGKPSLASPPPPAPMPVAPAPAPRSRTRAEMLSALTERLGESEEPSGFFDYETPPPPPPKEQLEDMGRHVSSLTEKVRALTERLDALAPAPPDLTGDSAPS